VFRPDQALACRREVLAMRAAADGGVPVPDVCADGVWQDRPALLLSWCAGQPVLHALRDRPQDGEPLGTAFGAMQARLHRVAAPGALRQDGDRWIDWADPDEAPLKARLHALRPRGDALLHLDYHPLNVLTDGSQITGVIDWANALAGDPRADLARTVTILRVMPVPRAWQPTAARRVFARAWRRGYESVAGPSGDLGLFYAWAGAVMVRDLAPKLGRPGVWLEQRHLDRVARWTAWWKRRAGV